MLQEVHCSAESEQEDHALQPSQERSRDIWVGRSPEGSVRLARLGLMCLWQTNNRDERIELDYGFKPNSLALVKH